MLWPSVASEYGPSPNRRQRRKILITPQQASAILSAVIRVGKLVSAQGSPPHFEYMRQRAAALKKPPPEPPKPVYAPGSLEYECQKAEKGE
jgi:hypothetical protein